MFKIIHVIMLTDSQTDKQTDRRGGVLYSYIVITRIPFFKNIIAFTVAIFTTTFQGHADLELHWPMTIIQHLKHSPILYVICQFQVSMSETFGDKAL